VNQFIEIVKHAVSDAEHRIMNDYACHLHSGVHNSVMMCVSPALLVI